MNAAASAPLPAAAVSLSRQEKEQLLQKMYHVPLWIELIRLFRYQTLPMDEARKAIKPIAEQYGKEPTAAACEVLVDISTQGSNAFARLKPHIRHMAFQILGPEPGTEAGSVPAVAPTFPVPEPQAPPPAAPNKTKKLAKRPSAPHDAATEPSTNLNRQVSVMEQYRAAKEAHPGMMLLFRIGDFYELFGEDAETAHGLLGLTLTTRDRTVGMAGFPHHQLEAYLHKLLQEGQRVAICEPVEETLARGPIGREVTRIVTPAESDKANPTESRATDTSGVPVRQPRHFVLKECEKWFTKDGLAFVAVADVKRTTPAVAPYVGVLDFVVLRGDEKLLVTVRPHLQAKHLRAIHELQDLYGPDYQPVRMWPCEGADGWSWRDYPIDSPARGPAESAKPRPVQKPPRTKT
jgi:hypothetical protein